MGTQQSGVQEPAPIKNVQELDMAQKAEHLGALAAQIIKMVPPEKRAQCKQLVQKLVEDTLLAI